MANHASHAALPYPVKGARFSILIPYWNSSGVPTDPVSPDTEASLDGAAPADTTEEVGTLRNSVGLLTLTGAETNASCVSVAAKASSGPNTTLMMLYPRVLPVLYSGTLAAGGSTTSTFPSTVPPVAHLLKGCILKTTGGTGGGGTGGANNQARIITAYTSGRVATIEPALETATDATTTFEVLMTEEAQYAMLMLAMIEPTAVPDFSAPLAQQLMYMFALSRNKILQTATTQTLRNDADSGNIGAASVSDDGTTFTLGEMG